MRVVGCLLLCVVSLVATPVFSQETGAESPVPSSKQARLAEARKAFAAGSEAYENGNFGIALDNFRRAYKLTKSPDLLYNIATVTDRMRRDDEALRAYSDYIRERPNSPDREHVQGRIKVLRAATAARQKAEAEAAAAAEQKAQEAAVAAEERIKKERPLTRYVGPGVGPWVTIGVASGALAAGTIVFALGQRDRNKVEGAADGTSFSEVQSNNDRAPRRTKIGIGMMGAGAAGIIGGIIWQLTGGREEALPEVSVGPGGVTVRGTF